MTDEQIRAAADECISIGDRCAQDVGLTNVSRAVAFGLAGELGAWAVPVRKLLHEHYDKPPVVHIGPEPMENIQ